MEERARILATARLWQPVVCLSLLAGIGASAFLLEATVHSEAFGIWMDRAWSEMNDTAVEYERQYLDTEDRIVLQDLAALDPSSGGVYFFGASNMKWAMRVPDLPPARRRLVHDFGAGEGSPYFHRQFTEYLVNHKGILRAGPDKTLIVYGACFINAQTIRDGPATFFPNLWRRYGLYRYDYREGIAPVVRGAAWDAYALEKARGSSFVQSVIERAGRLAVPKALRRRNTKKDPAVYAADYKRRMGPQWEEGIREHRRELQQWLDYVRAHKMDFEVVLLPLASWHDPLPYPAKYRAMIEEFCATNHVPLIDESRLLTDDEFMDHIHVNQQGLVKTDAALMDVARRFLRERGSWPGE
ncbi:MAG: hypothetical protein ACHQ49_03325 [Elusimicrobiota bacterium]